MAYTWRGHTSPSICYHVPGHEFTVKESNQGNLLTIIAPENRRKRTAKNIAFAQISQTVSKNNAVGKHGELLLVDF